MNTPTLHKLYTHLKSKKAPYPQNYTLPEQWVSFDYQGEEKRQTPSGEWLVDPYAFYPALIQDVFLDKAQQSVDYTKSIALNHPPKRKKGALPGDWLKEATIYSSLLRTSSAWDHDRDGLLSDANIHGLKETGTFLKMIALLPHLAYMGIDTLYLLPITKFSLKDKKGDLGSPYGVASFFALDPNLGDPLCEEGLSLDEQFQALVEAAHVLGIRVMIDIIPRTNAVENDLIKDHPDWFYWIKADRFDEYKIPSVDGIPPVTQPRVEDFPLMYEAPEVLAHLALFSHDPKTLDPKKWDSIKDRDDLSDAIEEAFNLKIAPAFSDHINDPQPPWTDITFFRMYLDHPVEAKPFLKNQEHPPYILFDTIKSNLYPGALPNMPLWETLSDIIPYYQAHFGIDGARIDMGHALPHALVKMILDKARAIDPEFAFIAEELNPKYAQAARDAGYNIIISNGFIMQARIWEGKARRFYEQSRTLAAPVFAGAETHDTPRVVSREGGETLAKTLTVLNHFMPNGVPFINAGLEFYEPQPMNIGLDATEEDLYRLPKDDPFYGKLALFDRYQLHYMHPRRHEIPNILNFLTPLRQEVIHAITQAEAFVPIYDDHALFVGFGYLLNKRKKKDNVLMVLGNLNPYHEVRLRPSIHELRHVSKNEALEGKLLFSTHEPPRVFTQFSEFFWLDLHLGAGEVKIVQF